METNTKLLLIILFIGLTVVTVFFVSAVFPIISIILLAALFAYILSPTVNLLESKGIPRIWGSIFMFILFFGAIGIGLYILLPALIDQVASIQEKIGVGGLRTAVRDLEAFFNKKLSFVGVRRWHFGPKLEEWVSAVFDNLFNIATGIVGLLVFAVMTLFATFLLLKDGPTLKKAAIGVVPNRFFEMTLTVFDKIDWSLGAYLRGILLDAFIIGNITTFALWMIGLPYFSLVGIFAGICNLVPYLGPPTGALLASIVSVIITGTFNDVPLIIFIFMMIRLLDDVVVQPFTISKSVKMHPLTVIFAILIGAQLYGIIGMLFAVPIAGIVKVILTELYFGLQNYRSIQS